MIRNWLETRLWKQRGEHSPTAIFFVLAFGLSWLFWIPAALLDTEKLLVLVIVLYFVGGFGPTVAGILVIGRTFDLEQQRDFVRRLFGFRRIGARWYALILLLFPLLALLDVWAYRLLQGSPPALPALEGIDASLGTLVTLVFVAMQVLLAGPPEEIGWRGFALDGLQKRWNALVASLILGGVWSLWHLPLFFIEGSMYGDWGFGSRLFWLFPVRMTMLSLVMTWVYNNNGRSILSAVLLHFMFNFTFGFFYPAPDELHLYGTGMFVVFAALVTWIWGPERLVRGREKTPDEIAGPV